MDTLIGDANIIKLKFHCVKYIELKLKIREKRKLLLYKSINIDFFGKVNVQNWGVLTKLGGYDRG